MGKTFDRPNRLSHTQSFTLSNIKFNTSTMKNGRIQEELEKGLGYWTIFINVLSPLSYLHV